MEQYMRRTLIPMEVKEVGDRQLEMAGSTEDVDRMGDVIKSRGWQLERFKKNPVVLWGHDYSQPPIGRARKVWLDKDTKRLMFNVEFADAETYGFADTIYKLYKGGFLHATSVGFIPLEWDGKDEANPIPSREGNVFTKQELLELSAVPVPANAQALVTARKRGVITMKEFKAITREPENSPPEPSVSKPEETDVYIRIPVKAEEGKHGDCTEMRTIEIDEDNGIQAIYCVQHAVVITYVFYKDKGWTIATAQKWVDDHTRENAEEPAEVPEEAATEGANRQPKKVGQELLMDDMAYIAAVIKREGLSKQAIPSANELAGAIIMRSQGNDIPVDILDKVGAVLNAKNRQKLGEIQRLAQDVLDSAVAYEEGEKHMELPTGTLSAAELRRRALDVAEVTQVVIAQLKGKRL